MVANRPEKTDAWMPLWIGAYLADTTHLSRDQHGGYLLLLMAYWRNKGPLIDQGDRLANIVKATPSEWRKLRPILSEFFDVADGMWSHGRANDELAKATQNKITATSKAKAGAEARWNKSSKNASRNALSDAPSMPKAVPEGMPQALPQGMQEQCPTPTPTPLGIGIPALVAKEVDGLNTHNAGVCKTPEGDFLGQTTEPEPIGTVAARFCKAMKALGIGDVNPGHADLRMLVEVGATQDEFEGAARDAVAKGHGFAYAIGIAKKRRADVAATRLTLHQGALPATAAAPHPHESFAERDARNQRRQWEQLTGRIHPENQKQNQPMQVGEYIDTEAKNIGAQACLTNAN